MITQKEKSIKPTNKRPCVQKVRRENWKNKKLTQVWWRIRKRGVVVFVTGPNINENTPGQKKEWGKSTSTARRETNRSKL